MTESDSQRWWGDFEVPLERWACWRIGPMTLWARPSPGEWRLAWHSEEDPLMDSMTIANPADGEPKSDELELARFALESVDGGLRLTPRLADLSVIVRPETALWIPPGQRTVLYVGTAVWIGINCSGSGHPKLIELPTFRPSDTWFGGNTRVGELCYASRTKARTQIELLGKVPHRAITPVELVNLGIDTLNVEQLRIPVRALSLYEADDRLWTDGIRFTREEGSRNAEFDIPKASKHLPKARVKIAEPVEPLRRKSVVEAFGSLFS